MSPVAPSLARLLAASALPEKGGGALGRGSSWRSKHEVCDVGLIIQLYIIKSLAKQVLHIDRIQLVHKYQVAFPDTKYL